jgi:hypothetical protein
MKLIKEMTMFNSPLSQAQIKQEIQQLVTMTVQIGPVQNQGDTQAQHGSSSFSNNSSSTLTKGDSSS